MSKIKMTLFLSLCLCLNGCSTPKSSFDCSYSKGVGCHSITEVNDMVNKGDFDKETSIQSSMKTDNEFRHNLDSRQILSSESSIVQRVTEEHLRVWVAPFQDEQGQFHEASVIHAVLRPGFWQVAENF
jgi:conjugal transfer pilus assembly protein TraV